MEPMRHVLIVCYDFPRLDAAGVIRVYQLMKGLIGCGWQPVVMTAQPCNTGVVHDIEASDGELPCPKVTVTGRLFSAGTESASRTVAAVDENPLPRAGKSPARYARQLAVPDGKVGWILPAVRRGLEIGRVYSFDLCFSTSPRPTAHFVGRRLARRLKIPWVADFALPWSDAHWLADRPQMIGWLDRRLERSLVRSARHITVAYGDIARSISARFGRALEQRMSVIPTGFSEDLFDGSEPERPGKFTVVYPGNHFCEQGRRGSRFLEAVDQWLASAPCLKDQIEFVFIGKRDEELLRCRAAMRHPEAVRIKEIISHRECVAAIRSSHACLVNAVGNRIPGKIYECLRAGKPILALAEPGSALDVIIRRYSRGVAVPADDKEAIVRALRRVYSEEGARMIKTTECGGPLARHDAARSAESLARVFDGALGL
jgi:glycosyltransferase involved in cell wall biosynthesis